MNAYRVILGCVVITCYLQQQGWAQTENVQPSIQQTQVDNQLQEEILGDVINQALLDMSKTQSHIQKRQTVSPLERFRQAMRNLFFFHFYCAARTVRRDMRIHYLDTVIDDHRVCSRARSYIVPLTGNLLQRYNAMDRPLCVDIAFYKAYRVKILSLPFANDTDTQRYLGYTDRVITALESIQAFRDPTCPDFTDAELLAIFHSYEDRYFWPENKFCILYSYFYLIWDHGIAGLPDYDLTLTSLQCNYPDWFWNY